MPQNFPEKTGINPTMLCRDFGTTKVVPFQNSGHRFEITNGPFISWPSPTANAARLISGRPISHSGEGRFGIGFAWNSFLHCRAVHFAHRFDFLRRALSVEIPVPAYICR